LAVVTTVVVIPAQTFSVSFQARVHAFTETVPVPLVMLAEYVAPTSARVPLLVTEKYCTGERPPLEKVKLVADGEAFHVPEVMVWVRVALPMTPA
jgi:hypothetical protein